MLSGIKNQIKSSLASYASNQFHFDCDPFPTVISNDCFGGEIYRALGMKYNTPFIGLGLMSPCYIKLLQNLEFYLSSNLTFTNKSKYPLITEALNKRPYPIGYLNNELEIQFVHFKSEKEAREKWEKRKKRMDLNNLFLKFDYSKDYSTPELLHAFMLLKYPKKLALGAEDMTVLHKNNKAVIKIPNYVLDATVLFRLSLRYIDYASLLQENIIRKPHAIKGYVLSKWLKPGGVDAPLH